jgi:putative endonuclease
MTMTATDGLFGTPNATACIMRFFQTGFLRQPKWLRRHWWYWRFGERLAAFYLQCRGYRILHRNIRASGVEVDIVAWRDEQLCIVEVKTRADEHFAAPEQSVDRARRQRQWRAAQALFLNSWFPVREVQFGVIAIIGWRLRFHSDAFDKQDL